MASIGKRVSGAWQNTSYGIRAVATDTITTLPTTIYGDGTNATVSIKGNTVQNGTPTPTAPIPVLGVGELDSEQYKIPISSANTTTPIYLGEVQTTRRIRKLVLTGDENWYKSNTLIGSYYVYLSSILPDAKPNQFPYCSHLDHVSEAYSYGYCRIDNNSLGMWMFDTNKSVADFKSYLQQQYAAGTPVCVWYVLAEPTTGIVNEPLMRIGDYADEVSGVSIPTTDGANTLSVDTTVQPSEVSVNYHGWHMGIVHERASGEWD